MTNPNDQHENEVIIKEEYFADKMSFFVILLAISLVIIMILLFMIFYIYSKEPESKYFLSNSNGQIFNSKPLEERMYTDAQIKDWAAQAVIRAFDFNFLNYRYQIANSKSFFTEAGYLIFIDQFKNMFMSSLTEGKFSSKLSLCDVATIDKSAPVLKEIDGEKRFLWLVTLPVYIEFQNNTTSYTIVAKILTKIQRMSDLDYLGGLAISDLRVVDAIEVSYANTEGLPVCLNG